MMFNFAYHSDILKENRQQKMRLKEPAKCARAHRGRRRARRRALLAFFPNAIAFLYIRQGKSHVQLAGY